jgi:hypothetical protein
MISLSSLLKWEVKRLARLTPPPIIKSALPPQENLRRKVGLESEGREASFSHLFSGVLLFIMTGPEKDKGHKDKIPILSFLSSLDSKLNCKLCFFF